MILATVDIGNIPLPPLLTIRPNPAQEKYKRCAAKHHPLRTILYWALLSLWRHVVRHQQKA
jgi:hypothetical protein